MVRRALQSVEGPAGAGGDLGSRMLRLTMLPVAGLAVTAAVPVGMPT
ncbi:hypothetical protein ACF1AB_05010 [Streptomyces sp. NPDC014846]